MATKKNPKLNDVAVELGHVEVILPSPVPRFFSAYSPKAKVRMHFSGPGRTVQSFKSECDINVIMARYQQTGILPGDPAAARYIDCTGYDYQEAQLLIAGAKSAFFSLPASIRDRFGNDPARLVEFAEDPANAEELKKLGVVVVPEEPESPPAAPGKGEVAPPPSPTPPGAPKEPAPK